MAKDVNKSYKSKHRQAGEVACQFKAQHGQDEALRDTFDCSSGEVIDSWRRVYQDIGRFPGE
jgi:hypothetical protein